jgi:hypothetical protein
MVGDEYVEAVLTLRAGEHEQRVVDWLSAHGLGSLPMRSGLLVQGTRQAFDAAFGVHFEQAHLPMVLPVPAELRDAVDTITVPAPRQYH